MFDQRNDKTRLIIGGIVITVLLLSWGIYSIITYRKYTQATVTATYWQLEIGLQQYQAVQESNWDYAPNGAYNISREYEYRTSERYISGYDEEGDPEYSSRSVYDYRYYYTIDRWVNIPPLITQGDSKETVEWPDITGYNRDMPDELNNIRLGQNKSHFWIIAKGKNKEYSLDMTENTWREYYKGKTIKLTLGFFGNVLDVD